MNLSLERFYRQFTDQTKKVSNVLDAIREGCFRLFIPTPQAEDQPGTIAQIKAALPYLSNVVRKPYVTIKTETPKVRTERAGNLSPAGIRETIRDGKVWKRQNDEIKPEFIYATEREDEFNSYENRLIKALIDRLIAFLRVPLRTVKESIPSLYDSYFQVSHLNKLDFMKFMRTDTFHQPTASTYDDYADLLQLKAHIGAYRQSTFYKTLDKYPAFTGQPEVTNLLMHNEDYHRCLMLWKFLDAHGAAVSTLSEAKEQNAYALFVFFGLLSAYLELGFILKDDPFIISSDQLLRIPSTTLENGDFIVEVWIPQDKYVQITVTSKAIKRKEKYKIRLVDDVDIVPEPGISYYISLFPTPYSDLASCVTPNNLNSIKDLSSVAKSTVLIFDCERDVYRRCCLVCGNTEISENHGAVTCPACDAKYAFLSAQKLWLHHFSILR